MQMKLLYNLGIQYQYLAEKKLLDRPEEVVENCNKSIDYFKQIGFDSNITFNIKLDIYYCYARCYQHIGVIKENLELVQES